MGQGGNQQFHNGEVPGVIAVSARFHERIAQISGNRFLQRLVVELNQRTAIAVALYDFFMADPPQSPREHREVVAALASGDPEHARRVMEEHVRATIEALQLPKPPAAGPGERYGSDAG